MNIESLKPLKTNLVLKKIEKKKEKKKNGILMLNQKSSEALFEVLSVGNEVRHIKVGDKVLISPYAGIEALVDDKKVMLIDERAVLAVYK